MRDETRTSFWASVRATPRALGSTFVVGLGLLVPLALATQMACTPPPGTPDAGEPDVATCSNDNECGEGAVCRGGICADLGCTVKTECAATEVCLEGICSAPPAECTSSEECPGALLCDGFSRQCFDPDATGCRTSTDCLFEDGCANGCTCENDGTCLPLPPVDAGPGEPGVDAGTEPDPPVDAGGAEPDPDPPVGDPIDLDGIRLENREQDPPSQLAILPAGTLLAPGRTLVIGRFATRTEFEGHWGVLPATTLYITNDGENNGVPIINGNESWAVVSAVGSVVDGPSIVGSTGSSFQRIGTGPANVEANWLEVDDVDATPGICDLPTTGVGLKLCEWSDASGSGNYFYEFLELYYAP